MNIEIANAMSGYFESLYEMNQNLIKVRFDILCKI